MVVDLSKLEPLVACHRDPGQRKKAKELADLKLDRAYVDSARGARPVFSWNSRGCCADGR
jgi:3-isopropylmalate/(R)-2-methylmalate dehydratase large subunit